MCSRSRHGCWKRSANDERGARGRHVLRVTYRTEINNEKNVILTEGLVLQEKTIWKNFLERDIISESNSCELYFEEKNIEAFVEKLDKLYPDIKFVNRLMTHSWGQKIVRFYDLDGNLIEVGTPM